MEGKLVTVRFVFKWSRREGIGKWLATSIDTTQCIIVQLVMTASDICPAGDDLADLTVKRVADEEIEYECVNRIYRSIAKLGDGIESAWPGADACMRLTNELEVASSFSHILSLDAAS